MSRCSYARPEVALGLMSVLKTGGLDATSQLCLFFLAGAAIAGPRAAIAQSSSRVLRLGTLTPGAPLDEKSPLGSILLKAMERHGFTQKSVIGGAGRPARSASLARLSVG